MSHFYAQIPNSARRTTPTARGHVSTGITTQAASWRGSVQVDLWHDAETGEDHYRVSLKPWQGAGENRELVTGKLGE